MPNWLARSGVLARYPRKWLLIGSAVLMVVAVGALFLLLGAFPTQDRFEVVVANNDEKPMVVSHCVGAQAAGQCDSTDSPLTLSPGQEFTTLTAVGADNPFVVHDDQGELLGCLTLVYVRKPAPTPTAYTSEAGWCGELMSQ